MLETSLRHGWKPAGTSRPPLRLDLDVVDQTPERPWDGSYRSPLGQIVLRQDAKAMAAALRRALSHRVKFSEAGKAFVNFCEQGGFILSVDKEAAMGEQLANLRKAVEAVDADVWQKSPVKS